MPMLHKYGYEHLLYIALAINLALACPLVLNEILRVLFMLLSATVFTEMHVDGCQKLHVWVYKSYFALSETV